MASFIGDLPGLDWPVVADYLGLDGSSLSPRPIACPSCGRPSAVYDTRRAGIWHHCSTCGGRDAIEFTAAILKILPQDAVYGVGKRLGPGVDLDRLWSVYASGGPRRKARACWTAFRQIAKELPNGPGQAAWRWIGACSTDQATSFLELKSRNRFFTDAWDRHMAVAPVERYPGYITGFAFIGQVDRGPTSALYNLLPGRPSGFVGIEIAYRAPSRGRLFAVRGAIEWLDLQSRQAATSNEPLPVIAWEPSIKSDWMSLARVPTLIMHEFDPMTIAAAAMVNGDIAAVDTIDRERPTTYLQRAADYARPWQSLVHDSGLSLQDAKAIATQIDQLGGDSTALLRTAGHLQSDRREIRVGCRTFVEQADGLYRANNIKHESQWLCVFGGQFRVTEIWNQSQIRGTLTIDDCVMSFDWPLVEFLKKGRTMLIVLATTNGVRPPTIGISPATLYEIAARIQQPASFETWRSG